jgi:nuclease S1
MSTRASLLLLATLACLPGPATAWGAKAHRVVGELAQRQLAPEARAEVARLLAGEADPTLGGIAYWADEQREAGTDLGKRSAAWHYVNFRDHRCEYAPARDCADGECIVAAINRERAVLADATRPDAERAQALKFVVHLVGDVHQPLHAGRGDDWGGNKVQLRWTENGKEEGTNLHSAWDRIIPVRRGLPVRAHADWLMAQPALPADPTRRSDRRATDWAVESCGIVEGAGFYPTGRTLTNAYVDAQQAIAERRLRQAGRRLADMLNEALARPAVVDPEPAR